MPDKSNRPDNASEQDEKDAKSEKPERKFNPALYDKTTNIELNDSPDKRKAPYDPWTVQTEGGFADSKPFYARERMDEVLGSDSTLIKHRKTLSERMRNMSSEERDAGIVKEGIKAEIYENTKTDLESVIIKARIERTTEQLDRNEVIIREIEKGFAEALNKRNVNTLKKLIYALGDIKIPGTLRKQDDNELDEDIEDINNQREQQLNWINDLQSELDEEIAEMVINDNKEFIEHNNDIIREIESEISKLSGGVDIDNPKKFEWSLRTSNIGIKSFIARLEGIKTPGKVVENEDSDASQFVNKEREAQLKKINHLLEALENALKEREIRLAWQERRRAA